MFTGEARPSTTAPPACGVDEIDARYAAMERPVDDLDRLDMAAARADERASCIAAWAAWVYVNFGEDESEVG